MNEMNEQTKKLLRLLIGKLRAGNLPPWRQPWNNSNEYIIIGSMRYLVDQWPCNIRAPSMIYGVMNGILLRLAADMRGYKSNFWVSQKAIKELNLKTRKGAEPVLINASYAGTDRRMFNVDQISNPQKSLGFAWSNDKIDMSSYMPKQYVKSTKLLSKLKGEGLEIEYGGNRACYIPRLDKIKMPHLAQFVDKDKKEGEALYWGVLWHEVVHWTGAPSRLDRTVGESFGDKQYAFEELIAELGACLLCSHLHIKANIQSASYVASWLKSAENSDIKKEETHLYNLWADLLEDKFDVMTNAAEYAESAKQYVMEQATDQKKQQQ